MAATQRDAKRSSAANPLSTTSVDSNSIGPSAGANNMAVEGAREKKRRRPEFARDRQPLVEQKTLKAKCSEFCGSHGLGTGINAFAVGFLRLQGIWLLCVRAHTWLCNAAVLDAADLTSVAHFCIVIRIFSAQSDF